MNSTEKKMLNTSDRSCPDSATNSAPAMPAKNDEIAEGDDLVAELGHAHDLGGDVASRIAWKARPVRVRTMFLANRVSTISITRKKRYCFCASLMSNHSQRPSSLMLTSGVSSFQMRMSRPCTSRPRLGRQRSCVPSSCCRGGYPRRPSRGSRLRDTTL